MLLGPGVSLNALIAALTDLPNLSEAKCIAGIAIRDCMRFTTADTLALGLEVITVMNNFGTIHTCFVKLGKDLGKVELLIVELSGDEPPPKEAE